MQSFWEDLVRARWKLNGTDHLRSVLELIRKWTKVRDRLGTDRQFDSAAYAAEFLSQAFFKVERLEPAGWNRCFAAAYWIKGAHPEKALQSLNESPVRLDPESEAAIRSRAHRALGRPECALDVLNRALLVCKTPKLFELRGEVYRDLAADEECIRDLAEALHLRARVGDGGLELSILRLLEVADQLCRRKEAVDLIRNHYEAWLAGLLRRRPRR